MKASHTINHTTLLFCILSLTSIYLHKTQIKVKKLFLCCVSGHAMIFTAFFFVLLFRWAAFFPLAHPSCFGTSVGAWARSFMSDTELSHCEQSVLGSMLTNELSPVSLEKSFQDDTDSRKSELPLLHSTRGMLETICSRFSSTNLSQIREAAKAKYILDSSSFKVWWSDVIHQEKSITNTFLTEYLPFLL